MLFLNVCGTFKCFFKKEVLHLQCAASKKKKKKKTLRINAVVDGEKKKIKRDILINK